MIWVIGTWWFLIFFSLYLCDFEIFHHKKDVLGSCSWARVEQPVSEQERVSFSAQTRCCSGQLGSCKDPRWASHGVPGVPLCHRLVNTWPMPDEYRMSKQKWKGPEPWSFSFCLFSGAQGEYAGLATIRAYLEGRGEGHRTVSTDRWCLLSTVWQRVQLPVSLSFCGTLSLSLLESSCWNI